LEAELERGILALAAAQDTASRLRALQPLEDVLDSALGRSDPGISSGLCQRLVDALISLALAEQDAELREVALHLLVCSCLLAAQQQHELEVGRLAAGIDGFRASELEYVLQILAVSRHLQSLPQIEKYLAHPNGTLRAAAQQAYIELSGHEPPASHGRVLH
jgi:hypothetical protein